MNPLVWNNRAVLITGHTGFKGGWLALWLHQLGAKIHGFAIDPPTSPNLFEVAQIKAILASDTYGRLENLNELTSTLKIVQPEVIFHLAAQPLVRESYHDPLGTFATNIMGTANVLEAIRVTQSVRAVIVITTDKVYQNNGLGHAYSEDDALGGHDPYSASKAAAEIVTSSYRASFFATPDNTGFNAQIATARAGNVIGGGDWAVDRLIPDCLRAFANGDPVHLRNPQSIRPWQHVLEPLAGYLQLAERLLTRDGHQYANAWNFGPDASGDATVGEVAAATAQLWGQDARVINMASPENPHEANILKLDSTRARTEIGWQPRWSLQQALEHTVSWHRAWMRGANMTTLSFEQILKYEKAALND